MDWGLVRKMLALPGMALVAVPAGIIVASSGTAWAARGASPGSLPFWLALFLGAAGLRLVITTTALFVRYGEGTPAPWEPPRKLVVTGPYRYVRNPMIIGALLILLAETLLFRSLPLLLWATIFFLVNALYFPLFEEKGLEKRFGEEYRAYKARVPRWLPRRHPWNDDRNRCL